MQDQRHPGTSGGLPVERRSVESEEPRTGIVHFEFMANDSLAAGLVNLRDLAPLELRDEIRNGLTLHIGLKPQKTSHRLVEVDDAPFLVHDEHAVFNRVKKSLQERALPGQALDHRLQALRVETGKPDEDLVEKAGFRRHDARGKAALRRRSRPVLAGQTTPDLSS